jgi:hypothetical protein
MEASVPGIFVAGDVRANSVKRVASAWAKAPSPCSSSTATWPTVIRPDELRTVPLLADLADEELAYLVFIAEEREYAPGQAIAPQGAPAESMFIILEGRSSTGRRGSRIYPSSSVWRGSSPGSSPSAG